MRGLFIILLIAAGKYSLAQDHFLYKSNHQIISRVVNDQLLDSVGQLLGHRKGNIIYTGLAETKSDIWLLTDIPSVKRFGDVYLQEGTRSRKLFYMRSGAVYPYLNDIQSTVPLFNYEITAHSILFTDAQTDTLLMAIDTSKVDAIWMAWAIYQVDVQLHLLKKFIANNDMLGATKAGGKGSIKLAWGDSGSSEWEWDGKILRPKWDVNPYRQWQFDGEHIQQVMTNNLNNQFTWDGRQLKALWGNTPATDWTWDPDNHLIKPTYDSDWDRQYILEGGWIKSGLGGANAKQWKYEGDIPIPLIILVISGLAPY